MKIIDLLNAKSAFDPSCKFDNDIQLAFKVIKFIKSIESDEKIYMDKYQDLVTKYAQKDDEGKVVTGKDGVHIAPERANEFASQLNDLNDVEVEAPSVKFTLDELQKCNLTGNGLYALYPFIQE